MITMHAPHRPTPQPNRGPARPSPARSTSSSGESGSQPRACASPFTVTCNSCCSIAPPVPALPALMQPRLTWPVQQSMHSFADPASERGGRVDERVAMAISHWAPRFTTNGVTAGDFERITSGLMSWNDWCSAWSAVAAEHELLGRDALAQGREMSAGAHLSRAAVYYHFAKFLFVNDPGQMRAAHVRAVACLTDALPFLDPPGRRVEIPFDGSHLV